MPIFNMMNPIKWLVLLSKAIIGYSEWKEYECKFRPLD